MPKIFTSIAAMTIALTTSRALAVPDNNSVGVLSDKTITGVNTQTNQAPVAKPETVLLQDQWFTGPLMAPGDNSVIVTPDNKAVTEVNAQEQKVSVTEPEKFVSLQDQWFTGSLIAPAGVLPAGHWNIQPYLVYGTPIGVWSSKGRWKGSQSGHRVIQNPWSIKYGLTDGVAIGVTPQLNYAWDDKKNSHTSGMKVSDLSLSTTFRFLRMQPEKYIPAVHFTVGGILPTGNYDRLNEDAYSFGSGNYQMQAQLQTQLRFLMPDQHPANMRAWGAFRRSLGSSRIHDISGYGTEMGFRGWGKVGASGTAGVAIEYGVTQQFVLAFDLVRDFANGSHVKGFDINKKYARFITPSYSDWTIAPAVEWNLSANYGFIGGVQFQVAGHNQTNYFMPQIAFTAAF